MANNYLEFSEVLTQLSEEEAAWLKNQLEIVFVFGDKEYAEGELPEGLAEKDADWVGCRAYRDMEDYEPDAYEGAGFTHKLYEKDADDRTNWGRHLWVYADESGDVDRVVHLVQKFLKKFRPDQCWSLTYATTCSKPRVGEFGGGAVFVTAAETKWQNAYSFIDEQEKAFKLQQDIDKLIQKAKDLGMEAKHLVAWRRLIGQLGLNAAKAYLQAVEGNRSTTRAQIDTGVYGIVVSLDGEGSGAIRSDLCSPDDGPTLLHVAANALESLILAHACAGIDICSPAYLEGVETAVDAITNHIENDQREVDTAKMFGTWKCGECGWTTRLSYVDLAEIGTPLCSECDIEMTLLD